MLTSPSWKIVLPKLPTFAWMAAMVVLTTFPGVLRAQETLKEFTSTEGKFSMLLPGTPKLHKQTVNGINNQVHILEAVGGVTYAASFFDLPPKVVLSLETSVQAFVKARKGTLMSNKKIVMEDEYPGRDVLIQLSDPSKAIRMRVFIIGQRYYQLIAEGSRESVTSNRVNEILDSFKRTGK